MAVSKDTTIMVDRPKCTATSLDSFSTAASDHHKHIPNIYKEKLAALEKDARHCKITLQDDLRVLNQKITEVEEIRDRSLRDIQNNVEVMIKELIEKGEKLKIKVEASYKKKREVSNQKIIKLQYETKKSEEKKDTTLRFINSNVQEMVKQIKENGEKMKNEVESMYKKENKVLEFQLNALRTNVSETDRKLSFIQLFYETFGT
ncbi:uncharacterized protein LOC117122807 [Anneissia japonica]|uniref:uncharacterized protein LOC117122807 n=1 Tax=Anneissia japonica TaxID=1529436 RepID=UPI0014257DBC|nr:uncharacterized protein LOC117122807 [Anneissia japonica]XP_033124449.1 uncharacterized protein LOC117122807 [Anneissia japonica]